jgi:hypothetical protein
VLVEQAFHASAVGEEGEVDFLAFVLASGHGVVV